MHDCLRVLENDTVGKIKHSLFLERIKVAFSENRECSGGLA